MGSHPSYTNAVTKALDDIPVDLSLQASMERVYGIQARATEKLLEGNSVRGGLTVSETQWYNWISKRWF